MAPYIVTNDALGLVDFIERGIGGKVTYEVKSDDGGLNHVELSIRDSVLMLGEDLSGEKNFPAMIHLYVPDADAAYERAIKEGAESIRAPSVQPDGDRRGGVRDKWGNQWWFTKSGINDSE